MPLSDVIQVGPGGAVAPVEAQAERLQELLENKDSEGALWGESWSAVDGTIVISFEGNEPAWLAILKSSRDDDGNTATALAPPGVTC